jgi:ferrous iron transport protein A
MAKTGEPISIKRIGGRAETRQFLETLGFVAGTCVTVVSKISGNVIVSVKESRVAISKEMASKIIV